LKAIAQPTEFSDLRRILRSQQEAVEELRRSGLDVRKDIDLEDVIAMDESRGADALYQYTEKTTWDNG